jgi:Spy/CpxP family protein refolding chaperone
MRMSSSARLPWILVALLVALNVTVLAVVWFRPAPGQDDHRHGPPPRGGLPKELGMNQQEADRVHGIQEAHFAKMEGFYKEIVGYRKEAFAQFGKPEADSAAAMAALDKIGLVQVKAEKERYDHFYEILSYCTPAQAKRFQEILPQVLQRKAQPENRPVGVPHPHDGPPH